MKILILIIISLQSFWGSAQNYTSYFTGNSTNITTLPAGGVCMMGGASEHDEAMKWFLNRANGGDVLVLRASGSDGYNNYMFSSLGVTVNSVETIVFNNSSASNDSYVLDKINNAEAIWFAGGDQWDYVSYWRNTSVDSLINKGISERDIVIGGTSAGMAILGGYYFSAENGTVTSSTSLSNPFDNNITVDSTSFLKIDVLNHVITDSHYDSPNRKGRHFVFLANIFENYEVKAKGIACNEYTAVCIDSSGIARVYGDYPAYDEDAYFLQINCNYSDIWTTPEVYQNGVPLTWNFNQSIVKVYKVHGTNTGINTFNLNTWETGSGGEWYNWYVQNGVFYEDASVQVNCSLNVLQKETNLLKIFPNPTKNNILIQSKDDIIITIQVYNTNGDIVFIKNNLKSNSEIINISSFNKGVYFFEIQTANGIVFEKILKM